MDAEATRIQVVDKEPEGLRALVRAVEAKDPYTRRHSEHVAHYCLHVGHYLEVPDAEIESIRIAALLHDIGKIGIPDHILTKPGPLNAEEFARVRRHPAMGAEILQDISLFAAEALLVRHHHERWDGGGYPDGLAGEAIPRGARIINVADAIDAMLMHRTYKRPYSVERVVSELLRCAGSQFDPNVASAAAQWCLLQPGSLILPS